MNGAFDWRMPVALRFGGPAAEQVAADLGDTPALLLTLDGPAGRALAAQFGNALGERLRQVVHGPEGLAGMAQARALCARLWPLLEAEPTAVLLAAGGGAVMDLAKVARCRPRQGTFDERFGAVSRALRGQAPWPALHLHRLWLAPTTAGTGSEVTRWATVWDNEQPPLRKLSLDEPFGYAERAYVDPALTLGCPPAVLRDSALDALSHALEAIWNHHANPLSEALTLRAARRVLAALPPALQAHHDLALRTELSLAALEAGLAFSQTRTALAHALSYAVTLEQGLPHGHAVALWLPQVWRLAVGHEQQVDAQLARVFGGSAVDGADRLHEWLLALGVDARPEAHGIVDGARRIEAALASPRGRNFVGAASLASDG